MRLSVVTTITDVRRATAAARDGMHKKLSGAKQELTDSLKMFKMGLEGGKPKSKSEAGVQPEWFYKGDGSWLVGPGQPLPLPSFAKDGGEEPELAGLAGTGFALMGDVVAKADGL